MELQDFALPNVIQITIMANQFEMGKVSA